MTVSLLESIRKVTGKEPTISYFALSLIHI